MARGGGDRRRGLSETYYSIPTTTNMEELGRGRATCVCVCLWGMGKGEGERQTTVSDLRHL